MKEREDGMILPDAWEREAVIAFNVALAAAQAKGLSLVKDKRASLGTSGGGYNYASSEQAIRVWGEVASEFGLAMFPRRGTAAMIGTALMLEVEVEITHKAGASRLYRGSWPIHAQGARTLDKAMGSAKTMALGYLIRDVLMLERAEEDHMDHPAQQTSGPVRRGGFRPDARREEQQQAAPAGDQRLGEKGRAWVARVRTPGADLAKARSNLEDLRAAVAAGQGVGYGKDELAAMDEALADAESRRGGA